MKRASLNHVYRLVWNRRYNRFVPAAETQRACRKTASGRKGLAATILGASALVSGPGWGASLPTNGHITAGTGTISQSGESLTVNQSSGRLAIDWNSFSIGQGNTVNFVQPSASAVVLNRVTGSDVSVIQGALNAPGHVFLVNPNGVLFMPTAQVNVGGLVASTLQLSDSDFMAGKYHFSGSSSNAIVNQANIQTTAGGAIALVAARIVNTGALVARGGSVLMGAGSDVTLDFGGPVKVQVNKGVLNALIDNGGAIQADGGLIYLRASAADTLLSTVINNTGVIRARTLANGETGQISLVGDMTHGRAVVGGTLDASAPSGGNGGAIETSAADLVTLPNLRVTASAKAGTSGSWLIDPYDYTIDSTAASNIVSALNSGTSVTVTTQSGNASYGSTGAGSGDITVSSAIGKTAGSNATLTLQADRDITVNAPITSSSGKLNVVLSAANASGATVGGVAVNANINSNGGDVLIGGAAGSVYNGIGYALNRTSTANPAVLVGTGVSIASQGGNITINGQSSASSSSYDGTKAGVYFLSGATVDSGGGNLLVSGKSTTSAKEFGISVEANSNTLTTFKTSGGSGSIVFDASNSQGVNGALGLVNAGNQARVIFTSPSVANLLFLINGSAQLTTFTYHPPCGNSSFPNCGTLEVPGSNGSYLYATYQAVNMATLPVYVFQTGSGSKVYDGTTAATGLSFSSLGAPSGFDVSNLSTYPVYATPSKNVGTYQSLIPSSGNATSYTSGSNTYAVGYFNNGSYTITPKSLTPIASDKVYDGTTAAAVTASGIVSGDNVNVSGTGSFSSANVGSYNNVSISGIALSGQDAGNYSLASSSVNSASASITPRTVTVSATKTYDGSTDMTGYVTIGNLVSGESLGYSGATANSRTVAGASYLSALSLTDGTNGLASNYQLPTLSSASANNGASITPKSLTVAGISAADKTYDGTTAATVSTVGATLGGLITGDAVTLASTGGFGDKNAAVGKTVNLNNSLSGADAANYTVGGQSTTTATITPKSLTVAGISAADKTYDGTTAATISTVGATLGGLITGDAVTLASTGAFGDKNAAVGKTVNLNNSLSGADAANYTVGGQSTTTASITPKSLTVAGISAADKTYDGTTAATVSTVGATLGGLITGDAVTLASTGAFGDKNAAVGKTVNLNNSL
ncbi:YDG domain-containing protein, partial [Burkholderia sp. 8Y]|uniref:YDG domain-containing protein n=1 Tax=Burkholderia sp. 8Y TaxID=2653133 RepID=UPI00135C5CB0